MADSWATDVITQLRNMEMTQKELAAMCGYTESYMSLILRGRRNSGQSKITINRVLRKITREYNHQKGADT